MSDKVIELFLYPDGTIEPPCVEVRGTQRLEVHNGTDQFPQYKQTLAVSLAGFPLLHIAPGATDEFAGSLGTQLRRGNNFLRVSPYDSQAQVWLY